MDHPVDWEAGDVALILLDVGIILTVELVRA